MGGFYVGALYHLNEMAEVTAGEQFAEQTWGPQRLRHEPNKT
jgi:hypothetical protein